MSSGRLRFAVLAATVAAFLLVPVAQAAASGNLKLNVTGPGSGVVTSESEFISYKGVPPIECSYASPGPATGVCENEMTFNPEESTEVVQFFSIAGGGSEVGSVIINKGTDEEVFGPEYGCNDRAGQEEIKEAMGGWLCGVQGVGGSPSAEVTVCFVLEGEGEAGCGPKFPTALTIAKTGEGTVISAPAGIECTGAKTGAECQANFEKSSTVTLTASPKVGYAFSAWSGCLEHVGLTCKVLMDKAKTVKVTFIATPSLTVEKAGSGAGKVTTTGIACDESCSKATSVIPTGKLVTIKATPAKGSEAAVFEGGTGSASTGCTGATCSFTISETSSVKVKFSPIPTKTLTVNITGPAAYKGKVTGKGIVKGLLSSAINCGSGCTTQTETFFSTDEVTLSAVAGTGYTFGGWSVSGGSAGTCTGTITPCTLKTDANKTVSAEFK